MIYDPPKENGDVISLLQSILTKASSIPDHPTDNQYLTYKLYQAITTHNLTDKCLSPPSKN